MEARVSTCRPSGAPVGNLSWTTAPARLPRRTARTHEPPRALPPRSTRARMRAARRRPAAGGTSRTPRRRARPPPPPRERPRRIARPAGGRARCLSVNAPPDTPRECHLPPRAPQSAESLVRAARNLLVQFLLGSDARTFGARGRRRAQRRSWRGARCGGPRVACRARLGRCGHRWRLEEDAPPGRRWVELANSAEAVEGLWF